MNLFYIAGARLKSFKTIIFMLKWGLLGLLILGAIVFFLGGIFGLKVFGFILIAFGVLMIPLFGMIEEGETFWGGWPNLISFALVSLVAGIILVFFI
jgi:hypothetical protein